jgi:sugar (pentulose or hexulose) kinase
MVHCNNGASELAAWAGVFQQFAAAVGAPADSDAVFTALLNAALAGAPDGGGLLAYNYLSGEPVVGLDDGRPLFVRTPGSDFRLENFARAQVYSVFATLSLGMTVLADEDVRVDTLLAHGGLFRTPGPSQRLMAAATGVPIAVQRTAGDGGAWGIALLAAYLDAAPRMGLGEFLDTSVFTGDARTVVEPEPDDVAGFAGFLERYRRGLELQRHAPSAVPESPA